MSLFAVISEGENSVPVIEVMHINYWCLGGLFRRVFLCDIGVKFTAHDQPVDRILIVVPFTAAGNDLIDLYDTMAQHRVSALVFGEPLTSVTTDGGVHTIKTGDNEEFRLHKLALHKAAFEPVPGPNPATICTIWVDPAVSDGDSAYFRARFRVADPGRTWLRARRLLRTARALVDVRVNDMREVVDQPRLLEQRVKVLDIKQLNVFVIDDWRMQMRVASPPTRHIRILEGHAWERYLGRTTDLLKRDKLVIYYWRPDPEEAVTRNRPFRAFLDLSSEQPLGSIRQLSALFLIVLIGTWIGAGSGVTRIRDSVEWLAAEADRIRLGTVEFTVVGILLFVSALVGIILFLPALAGLKSRLWGGAVSIGRWLEREMYRPR
jgi:hypothetical protein